MYTAKKPRYGRYETRNQEERKKKVQMERKIMKNENKLNTIYKEHGKTKETVKTQINEKRNEVGFKEEEQQKSVTTFIDMTNVNLNKKDDMTMFAAADSVDATALGTKIIDTATVDTKHADQTDVVSKLSSLRSVRQSVR